MEQKDTAHIIDLEFYIPYLLGIPKVEVSEPVTYTLLDDKGEYGQSYDYWDSSLVHNILDVPVNLSYGYFYFYYYFQS